MPKVASYCTIFLKPEMLHIYRQVTGLKRYENVVLTKTRQQEGFAFDNVTELQKPRVKFYNRFTSKYIRKEAPFFYRGEYGVLDDALQAIRPDLLHVYFGHTGVHLLPYLERTKLPTVVSFHGADVMPREERPGYLDQLKKLLQVITLVLARSDSLAQRLRDLGCPPAKIRINRTGIPLDQLPFVDRSSRTASPVRFIQACRLIEKKGLRTTIEAFASIRRQLSGSSLVIAGEGPLKDELSSLVARLGLAPYVQFVGFLDQPSLRDWYSASDIFVHPSEITSKSDQEGVPNSLLEAMATGLPIVSTLHGGIPEAVENGRTGLLVPERNAESLATAMLELAEDFPRRMEMGRLAAASVGENFEQSAQISRLEGYYDEAIELAARIQR
ncbi:MAG TPA: glycosyltransferase [Chthoniobacterales bacterium]|jgi:colanic acid/amylovoran biosynthesis glycosyltransferase